MNIRMTIGRKLLGMSVLGAILTLAVGVAGYWGMQSISRTTHDMLAQEAQIARHSARLRAHVLGLRRYEKDMFINLADARKVDDYEKKYRGLGENIRGVVKGIVLKAIPAASVVLGS